MIILKMGALLMDVLKPVPVHCCAGVVASVVASVVI